MVDFEVKSGYDWKKKTTDTEDTISEKCRRKTAVGKTPKMNLGNKISVLLDRNKQRDRPENR